MRIPLVQDFAVIIVVAVTAWAAFASNHAANEVQKTQDDQVVITTCTAEFLASTMEALNERTTFTKEQAEANVELQKAQAAYVGIFFQDPPPIPQQAMEALRKYFDKLTEFITINAKALAKVEQNPFPTVKGYNRCLHPDR